jgi:hypothetical protein
MAQLLCKDRYPAAVANAIRDRSDSDEKNVFFSYPGTICTIGLVTDKIIQIRNSSSGGN